MTIKELRKRVSEARREERRLYSVTMGYYSGVEKDAHAATAEREKWERELAARLEYNAILKPWTRRR